MPKASTRERRPARRGSGCATTRTSRSRCTRRTSRQQFAWGWISSPPQRQRSDRGNSSSGSRGPAKRSSPTPKRGTHCFPAWVGQGRSLVEDGAERCTVVYLWAMSRAVGVRQSVSLPSAVAKRVRAIAKTRKVSANRVLVDLIETGLQAKESERERFLVLARRFKESSDPGESERLRDELARRIFGE
jgi:hypothetical protein